MQPCDAGIVAAMKIHYRTFQLERALDLADGETKNVYHVDILPAMLALKKIWNDLSISVIQDCWRHTGNLSTERSALLPVIEKAQREHVCSMVAELVPSCNRISKDELLNPAEEEECVQDIADGVVIEELQLNKVEEEVPPIMSTFAAQMQTKAVLRQVVYAMDDAPPRMSQDLRVLHASIREKRALNAGQTTIDIRFC